MSGRQKKWPPWPWRKFKQLLCLFSCYCSCIFWAVLNTDYSFLATQSRSGRTCRFQGILPVLGDTWIVLDKHLFYVMPSSLPLSYHTFLPFFNYRCLLFMSFLQLWAKTYRRKAVTFPVCKIMSISQMRVYSFYIDAIVHILSMILETW